MSSHGYNSRNNTPPTENQTSQQSNVSTDQSSNDEMSLITHLESILLSHFDNLSTEFLNLKDIIIKKRKKKMSFQETEFLVSTKEMNPLNVIITCSNNMGDETISKLQAFLILSRIMNWKMK